MNILICLYKDNVENDIWFEKNVLESKAAEKKTSMTKLIHVFELREQII